MTTKIGVIGLSVMGANIAQNIADKKISVYVYNRSPEKTQDLVKSYPHSDYLVPFYDLSDFVSSLESPRQILLMIQAGDAVDQVIDQLVPLLNKNDIIIDGGNSNFADTIRREQKLSALDIHFVGMGISGGEEGARHGPSLMPGGSEKSYQSLFPILNKIAATDFTGNPCVCHVGENGAGHFVKMVHNAIEYIDMQLIAEIYWLLKMMGKTNPEMSQIFSQWNQGRLNSYLIEITAKILNTQNPDGRYVIDTILDTAGSKGTGMWASVAALNLGVYASSISTAVFARYLSAQKVLRLNVSKEFPTPTPTLSLSIDDLENTLYVGKILAYAQGYDLISKAQKEYGWNINFEEISRIWQGGCIIRAKFLQELTEIFKQNPQIENIILSPNFKSSIKESIPFARKVANSAISNEIAISEILSSISYFDSLKSANLPTNLVQAQRDFFGAHTFQTELNGEFIHFNWS